MVVMQHLSLDPVPSLNWTTVSLQCHPLRAPLSMLIKLQSAQNKMLPASESSVSELSDARQLLLSVQSKLDASQEIAYCLNGSRE